MPNASSLAAIAQGHLVQTIDDSRAANDPFHLPAFLRTAVNTGLAALETADNATALTESDRAGGSAAARTALTAIEILLRDGYNAITAIPSLKINAAQRLEVYTTYGWSGGKLGTFNDARRLGLARLGVRAEVGIPAAWAYSAELVTALKEQLDLYNANAAPATGGDRSGATKKRDEALDEFETTLARVRFYYCCASADADQTTELTRIGFQPRRDPTPAAPEPVTPEPPAPTPNA